MATTCLQSTVKNTSGSTQIFSFLPGHGVTLTSGEEKTYTGDIVDLVSRKTKRDLDSFLANLESGAISIVSTPAPVLYDETDDISQRLVLDNSTLFATDVCWDDSGSSEAL